MSGFELRRLGLLMEPEAGNPLEHEGVLNPAATRGPDGELYLFPRLVAQGNISRIGIARVRFNDAGDPAGVERLGIALEPEADYERRPDGSGGCEDPRVTYVEPLRRYVMTYTALTAHGPRIAFAVSEDLLRWERVGLATFEAYDGIEFDGIDNKDGCVFPAAIANPSGEPSLALLHRPLFPGTRPEERVRDSEPGMLDIHRESIWISYRSLKVPDEAYLCLFTSHHRLAAPQAPWERLKIGSGTPPIRTPLGWLIIYHGVSELAEPSDDGRRMCYAAGAMVLSAEQPQVILYRSAEPVLTPVLPEERIGTIGHVVFPTGLDRRDDLGQPGRFDVYYGMADDRVGVARLDLPDHLS